MNEYFLSCDWGTSSLRMTLVKLHGARPVRRYSSGEGIRALHEQWLQSGKNENEKQAYYLSFLSRKYQSLSWPEAASGIRVIVSGMASAGMGIIELPYATLPFSCNGEHVLYKLLTSPRGEPFGEIAIISGLRTEKDVMRGEETQLIGAFSGAPAGIRFFIFPGTHSKHVKLHGVSVKDIRTYMTGEVFALLANQSILSGSINLAAKSGTRQSDKAFREGVLNGLNGHLLHEVFMIRTRDLLLKINPSCNKYFLSGLLIGYELKDLRSQNTAQVSLVGSQELVRYYRMALQIVNKKLVVKNVNAETATIRGHMKLYKQLFL